MAPPSTLEMRLMLEDFRKKPDKKASCQELTLMVVFLHDENKKKDDVISSLEEKVERLNNKTISDEKDSVESRLFSLENKNIAPNLILKGMGMTGEIEAKDVTKEKVIDLLNAIEVDPDCLEDCYRFKRSEKADPAKPPVVLVRLKSPKLKGQIYKSLFKLKNTDWKVTVRDQFPAALGQAVFEAEKKAYEIRKTSNFTLKTRIAIVRGKVLIKQKAPGATNFTFME